MFSSPQPIGRSSHSSGWPMRSPHLKRLALRNLRQPSSSPVVAIGELNAINVPIAAVDVDIARELRASPLAKYETLLRAMGLPDDDVTRKIAEAQRSA